MKRIPYCLPHVIVPGLASVMDIYEKNSGLNKIKVYFSLISLSGNKLAGILSKFRAPESFCFVITKGFHSCQHSLRWLTRPFDLSHSS